VIEKKVASRIEFLRNYAEYLTERAHSYRRLNYAVERVKLDSCKEWARQLSPGDLATNITSLCGQLRYLLQVQVPDVLTGSVRECFFFLHRPSSSWGVTTKEDKNRPNPNVRAVNST